MKRPRARFWLTGLVFLLAVAVYQATHTSWRARFYLYRGDRLAAEEEITYWAALGRYRLEVLHRDLFPPRPDWSQELSGWGKGPGALWGRAEAPESVRSFEPLLWWVFQIRGRNGDGEVGVAAGSVFRKVETLTHGGMTVDRHEVGWHGSRIYAQVFTDSRGLPLAYRPGNRRELVVRADARTFAIRHIGLPAPELDREVIVHELVVVEVLLDHLPLVTEAEDEFVVAKAGVVLHQVP